MNQINSIIKQNNNNFNKENNEINIQEKILNEFIKTSSKLTELKSINDLTEQDYNEIKMKIEFVSKAISLINKILLEKGSNFAFEFNLDNNGENKDDLLVREIILNLENKLEEFKIKNKDNMNNKMYPFLDDEIQSLMENIRKNKENDINLNNNNYYFPKSNQFNKNNNLFSENNNYFKFQFFSNNNSTRFKNNYNNNYNKK